MSLDINKFEKAYHDDVELRKMIDRLKEDESHSLSTESKELSKMVMDKKNLNDSDMAYMRLKYGTPLTISDSSYNNHPFTPYTYKEVISSDKQYSNDMNTVGMSMVILIITSVVGSLLFVAGASVDTMNMLIGITASILLVMWIALHLKST